MPQRFSLLSTALLFVFFLTGCSILRIPVPMGGEEVIPQGVAASWEEFQQKLMVLAECVKQDELWGGEKLTIPVVFQYLHITDKTPAVRELITVTQKQEVTSGKNTYIHIQTLAEKNAYERDMDRTRIFELTWRELNSTATVYLLKGLKTLYCVVGIDATSYLIFKEVGEEGFLLTKVLVPQQAVVNRSSAEYLPHLIGTVMGSPSVRAIRENVP